MTSSIPYRPISEFYFKLFGEKVYKIPLAFADNCPNRMGINGMETCVFCDEYGSAADTDKFGLDLHGQIENYKQKYIKKYKAKKFLAYFQAYTNTFVKATTLKKNLAASLQFEDMVGIVLGTRPDCLSPVVLEIWNEITRKAYLGVELGVQSFFEDDLEFMKRGHDVKSSLKAIDLIAKKTSVDLGIHLIFGNPNETDERILETAKRVNDLPIRNIKLHHLHVLKNTTLETIYRSGGFQPVDFETYCHRVDLFLSKLDPRFYIHRLAGFSPRWDELVAPAWTANKMKTHQEIIDYLHSKQTTQGCRLTPDSASSLF
ncbi:MAG: TIGR01212 family radical SAM protein [Pseudobdellovibrionaceae bacterium]